jgi:hypothetical protein
MMGNNTTDLRGLRMIHLLRQKNWRQQLLRLADEAEDMHAELDYASGIDMLKSAYSLPPSIIGDVIDWYFEHGCEDEVPSRVFAVYKGYRARR